MPPDYVPDAKALLRRQSIAKRSLAHRARDEAAAAAIRRAVLESLAVNGKTIAAYWPLGDELDVRPVLGALHAAGAQVALPVVAGQGQVLLFRAWAPGDVLELGPFGTSHPAPRAPVVQPEICLLPCVAFDAKGQRLGYGAGYYDRTIAAVRPPLVIGIAYDEQEIAAVPTGPHDQPMDAVITDTRVLWFNSAARARAK